MVDPITHDVFISYARSESNEWVEKLRATLGERAFRDADDIPSDHDFPNWLADALFASRVVVVYLSASYFKRSYCWKEWKIARAAYDEVVKRRGAEAERSAALQRLLVVLPTGLSVPAPLERMPPAVQRINLAAADDIAGVVEQIEERLEVVRDTVGDALDTLGVTDLVRADLAGTDPIPAPRPPTGRVFPASPAVSLADRFFGRAVEINQLDDLLMPGGDEGAAVASVTGAIAAGGGFGKSRLALEYLWRYNGLRYPGGVFWIDAAVSDDRLHDQWHGVLTTFDETLPSLPAMREAGRDVGQELVDALKSHVDDGPKLVVLDNVPEPEPGEAPCALSSLFPGLPWVTVLATSRRSVPEARGLKVDVLEPAPAREMLTVGDVDFSALPAESWDVISEWVGRLPLVLELLNQAIAHGLSPKELLGSANAESPVKIADVESKALEGVVPEGALRGIAEALSISYDRLPDDVQTAARIVAYFAPATIPSGLLSKVAAPLGGKGTERLLVARSFLTRERGEAAVESWAMHRVLGEFLRQRSDNCFADWRAAMGVVERVVTKDAAVDPEQRDYLLACVGAIEAALLREVADADQGDGNRLVGVADVLNSLGQAGGQLSVLVTTEGIARRAVQLLPRSQAPLQWADAQHNLGFVLQSIGQWRGEETTLEAAIAAYRAALQERTRARVPMKWAMTQNNLGIALQLLGKQQWDEALLEAAVEAYQAALEVHTRTLAPRRWALTQNNLGNALQALGKRQGDTLQLEAAVEAYRSALAEHGRLQDRVMWATTQSNLGTVLCVLGSQNDDEVTLEAAVEAYESALLERTRARGPMAWAITQTNLGNALRILGERRGHEATLEAARATLEAALEVWTEDRVPAGHALAMANLQAVEQALRELRGGAS